jgi:cytochrome oxidase Cu insertion factor (SCO1/SenC/PrrC family)
MKLPRVLCATLVALLMSLLVAVSQAGPTTGPSDAPSEAVKTGTNVGDAAPEIKGKDINGKAMKLSDYRGKVVLLDFFGDW